MSCGKEKLVLDDYSTEVFDEVVIIDSLFKDSLTLSFFDNTGAKYLNFNLSSVQTTKVNGNFNIIGQFTVLNLLGNQMTSGFGFTYVPIASSFAWKGFLYWSDYIGTTYYSNTGLNDMLTSMDNIQLHISGDYQLDSVTFIPITNNATDSLFGTPSLARFYPK